MDITQEALARKLEVSLSTIARWEQLRHDEIPNSKLLDLALVALETPNFFVLEYSRRQGAYHKHTIRDMINVNIDMILSTNKSNDFLPIAISPSEDDLRDVRQKFGDLLREVEAAKKREKKEQLLQKLAEENRTGVIAKPRKRTADQS